MVTPFLGVGGSWWELVKTVYFIGVIMPNNDSPTPRRKLFDDSPYQFYFEERKNPIQKPLEPHEKKKAHQLKLDVPGEWHEHIMAMAKKCRCQPDFLYRKAIQAFFGFSPAIFNDDGYLEQWKEVFDLEKEEALRPWMQTQDDDLTRKIVRERDKQIKQRRENGSKDM